MLYVLGFNMGLIFRNCIYCNQGLDTKKPRENHPGCPSAKKQNFLIDYGWVAHCGLKIGAPIAPLYFRILIQPIR